MHRIKGGLAPSPSPPLSPRRRGPRPVHSIGNWPSDPRFRRVTAEVSVDKHPPLPTLSPSRGERVFYNPRHCERSEATQ
jgi:hypothetical protein